MAANEKPSERIKKGVEAFADIAERVAVLEDELADAKEERNAAEERAHDLWDELDAARVTEGLIDGLEDVRRGVRTIEELYEAFCNPMLSMAA